MEQTYTAIETWGGFLAFTDTEKAGESCGSSCNRRPTPISIRHSIPERYMSTGPKGNLVTDPGSTRGGCGRTSTLMVRSPMAAGWNSSTAIR